MTTFYRKYRPQTLSEIIGQEHIVESLLKQLERKKIQHAYLFTGPKGTGKTSTARIIAKAVNCEKSKSGEPCDRCESCLAITKGTHLDLIEIDAASNRGIDDVRDLRDKIKLSPSKGPYKIYILDEAHMLTAEAFNALLKTLEEPPKHAIFILATTEPHKIPGTIVSRTQRFDFERPNINQILIKLGNIVKLEKLTIEKEGLEEIAKASDGAFRNAEVLLEKVATINPRAKKEEILQIIGKKKASQVLEIIEILEEKNAKKALLWLDNFIEGGGNIRVLNETILEILRQILLIKNGVTEKLVRDLGKEEFTNLESLTETITPRRLTTLINLFTRSIEELSTATIPQLPMELAVVEACDFNSGDDTEGEVAIGEEVEEQPKPVVKVEVKAVSKKIKPIVTISDEKLLKEVKKAWPKILREIKPKNNSLAMFLKTADMDRVEDGILYLKFYYNFHKDMIQNGKNRDLIEQTLEEIVAKPVRIKGELGGKLKANSSSKKKEEVDPATIFGQVD